MPRRSQAAKAPRAPLPARGRYDFAGARDIGRDPLPRSRNVFVADVAITNPISPHANDRILGRVNRNVDVLEFERSHGRIDEAQYQAGRQVQRVFTKALRLGSSSWGERSGGDAWIAHELSVIYGVDNARAAVDLESWLRRKLGDFDAQIMRWLLADGHTFSGVAALTGPATEKRTWYIAERFRDALRRLANLQAARGPARDESPTNDESPARRSGPGDAEA